MSTVSSAAAAIGLFLIGCAAATAASPQSEGMAQSGNLAGPRWTVETIGGVAVIDRTKPYLQFGADGRFSGSSGCNSVMGGYEVTDDSVSLRQVATTRMGCPRNLGDQEQRFVAVLNAITRFEIAADGALVLTTETGESIRAVTVAER